MAPAIAALGALALVLATALSGYGSWWPVLGAAVYALTSAAAVSRPLKGPLDWLVPPVFRAAEYGTILLIAAKADVNGALLGGFRTGGRGRLPSLRHGVPHPRWHRRAPHWLVRAIGGHEGRTLVVTAIAVLLTATDFTVALTALAGFVALVVLAESIRFWVSAGAPAVHDEGEPA